METTLVWMLIFAAASIVLLGVFLFASEKELKVKRQEVEALLEQLGESTVTSGDPAANACSPGLGGRNEELAARCATLTAEVQNSQQRIRDLENTVGRLGALENEIGRLQNERDRLAQENASLREQLSEPIRSSAVAPSPAGGNAQLEEELAQLRIELARSREQIHELQNREPPGALEAASAENETLRARIDELEGDFARAKAEIAAVDHLQKQLNELAEERARTLEENHRLQQNLRRYETEIAAHQESQRRLERVGHELRRLELHAASLSEDYDRFRQTVTGLHAVLENGATAPPKLDLAETQPHGSSSAASSNMKQGFRSHGSYPPEADQAGQTSASNTIAADRDDSAAHGQPPPEASFAIHPNGGHGYKVFVAMIPLLLITGTVLAGFLRKQSIEAETAAMSDFSGPNETAGGGPALGAGPTAERRGHPAGTEQPHTGPIFAASYQGESDGAPAADPAQPERARDDRLASDPAGAPSVSNAGNPPGRFWGSYRIVRPTQVHKEPNESSPAVSKLDAGAQVNVVAGADGWLEIRSQDGRPSGFIKSETAARKR